MKKHQALKKLENIVAQDLPELERNIIIRDGNDVVAFGHYKIQPRNGIFCVTRWTDQVGEFTSSRLALSWCIADRYQKYTLANDIMRLSRQQNLLSSDLRVRSALSKKIQQPHWRENVELKIQRKRQRLQHIEIQLDKCVNLAKYWQLRGFNNETARTGRTASPRTSR
jgi:hypothetical protein